MGDLRSAIAAWRAWRTPAVIRRELQAGGADALQKTWADLAQASQAEILALAERLENAGVQAFILGDADYPPAAAFLKSPPPILFAIGNTGLLNKRAVGVCGARAASSRGIEAARALASLIARSGDVLVAGNAQGVDAEAQGSALASDGSVISVLPDGISHLRWRTGSADVDATPSRQLAISQFPPWQPWSVGGAMTRNELIIGLSSALVVIEAGERGGTLAAGETALKLDRPVIVLNFGHDTPMGNKLLMRLGARAAKNPAEVYEQVAAATAQADDDLVTQIPLSL
jgi:DNA processing protein